MICWHQFILFVILILCFCLKILDYIIKRNVLKKYTLLLDGDYRFDDEYININKWLKKKIMEKHSNNEEEQEEEETFTTSITTCRELALLVPENRINEINICKKLGRRACGLDSKFLEMVHIPLPTDDKTIPITYLSANGMHLVPGKSYCIFKKPPLNSTINCNEKWGFWKYSPVQDRWVCHSKVPGIYDSERDEFRPCNAGGGQFIIDNVVVPSQTLANDYQPEQFYDVDFQKRCGCICNKQLGYIFNPQKSLTTCYKDPCLIGLPPFSFAPGFDHMTGECRCGKYFTNIFNDNNKPCTACPFDKPHYDEKSNLLTIFIRCGKGREDLFPCESDEDEIRGCMKALVKVKPISQSDIDDDEFRKRVFW